MWKRIGLDLAVRMHLIKNINILSSNKTTEKYSSVFNGLGLLGVKCHMEIGYKIVPIVNPPRKIPFSIH